MIHRHERKSRIDLRIHDGDIEFVGGVDRLPIVNGRASERVDAEFESCGVNRLHVYHVSQVIDVRRNRSEEHTSELQSRVDLVCRLLLEKKKKQNKQEKQPKPSHNKI